MNLRKISRFTPVETIFPSSAVNALVAATLDAGWTNESAQLHNGVTGLFICTERELAEVLDAMHEEAAMIVASGESVADVIGTWTIHRFDSNPACTLVRRHPDKATGREAYYRYATQDFTRAYQRCTA
jgi:hypothetical protein